VSSINKTTVLRVLGGVLFACQRVFLHQNGDRSCSSMPPARRLSNASVQIPFFSIHLQSLFPQIRWRLLNCLAPPPLAVKLILPLSKPQFNLTAPCPCVFDLRHLPELWVQTHLSECSNVGYQRRHHFSDGVCQASQVRHNGSPCAGRPTFCFETRVSTSEWWL
jgi:hypothetical protein